MSDIQAGDEAISFEERLQYEEQILAAEMLAIRLRRLIMLPSEPGSYKGDTYYPVGGSEASHRWSGTSWEWLPELQDPAAALPRLTGWQPIETAPMDGTPALLFGPAEDISVAAWRGGQWACLADGQHAIAYQSDFGTEYIYFTWPTHWMPLPDAPALGSAS